MCGFVGYLLSSDTPPPALDTWSEYIRHRGPNQAGTALDHRFGVATRRLSILDLSAAGNQPMESERFILAFNGEIYNHLELRSELCAAGIDDFRSHSDTETVLRAIGHWGVQKTLNRLNGMYALAVWDKHTKQLTIARDPLGVKPLLYIHNQHGLYFASELKALLPYSPKQLSREGIALYLFFGFAPAPYSLVEGIRKVRPGEVLVFDGPHTSCYRIHPEMWTQAGAPSPAFDERVDQVRSAVEAAVQRQLLSDVPVGIFLSGGVDSSIVGAVAAHHNSAITSFSIRPGHTSADPGATRDADLAAAFARQLGLDHHELLVQPDTLVEQLDSLMDIVDEPVSELYFAAEVLLSKKARAAGVPVVLTGHGADEVFLGYPSYQAQVKGDRYNQIPFFGPLARVVAGLPRLPADTRNNLLGAASIWRKHSMERYAIVSAVNHPLDDAATLAGIQPSELQTLIMGVLNDVYIATSQLPRADELSTAELYARMDTLLKVPEHYNMRLDRASMAASVEARVPLQDLELIGVVARLPLADLWHGGLKGLLKTAFADVLPADVVNRKKQTFQAPMLSWLRGPIAAWVAQQVAQLPASSPLAQPAHASPTSTRHAYRIWSVALLEGWRNALQLEY